MDQIWRFKKALQSINSYPSTLPFKQEIQRGNRQLLTLCLSEIDIILSNPNQPPFSKFLALRFCKEIMLYGRPEIIAGMEKVIPAMTKIASYRMEVKDGERGSTFFRNTPDYGRMSVEEKLEIDRIGCSFLILALQSIKMWASWVPVNVNGSESSYKRAYDSLIERGVAFPSTMKYYKQNDTEIFNQTYKVEFFENSDLIENSEMELSQINIAQHMRMLAEQREILNRLIQTQSPELQTFHKNIVSIRRENEGIKEYLERSRKHLELQELVREEEWMRVYLENHKQLQSKRITYNQFSRELANSISTLFGQPPLQVKPQRTEMEPVILPTRPSLGVHTNGISLTTAQPVIPQPITTIINEQIRYHEVPVPVQIGIPISSQEDRVKISMLSNQLRSLESQKEYFRNDLEEMRIKYEGKQNQFRIELEGVREENGRLIKQLGGLKRQMEELITSHSAQITDLNRQLHETNKISEEKLVTIQHIRAEQEAQEVRKLKYVIETERNEKMKHTQDTTVLRQQIFKLQEQLQGTTAENQNIKIALDKVAKEKSRLNQEILLYKAQLSEERTKQHGARDFEVAELNESVMRLSRELEAVKQELAVRVQEVRERDLRLVEMQKRIGVVEEEKRKQMLNYQLQAQTMGQMTPQLQASRSQNHLGFTNSFRTELIQTRNLFDLKEMISGMDQYYTFFVENSKELRIRFCKAALKSKQLLFKSNQLEVGVIWNRVTTNNLRGIFHYTNNSTADLQEFRTKIYTPKGMRIDVMSPLSLLLPASEQEKEEIGFEIIELPLRKVVLEISYVKEGQPKLLTLLLPIFLLKYVEYYPPRRTFSEIANRRQFIPSSKITKSIASYFQDLRQVSQSRFEAEIAYPPMNLSFKLIILLEGEMMILEVHSQSLTEQQIGVLDQYLNQLQYILS